MNMKQIIIAALMVTAAILAMWFGGCTQRIVEYDKQNDVYRYKSNSFATDTGVDEISLLLPNGVHVTVNKLTQDNDSINLKIKEPKTGIELGLETEE